MELFRKIVYKKKGDLVDLISERISCHPKKRRERANERKSANILLSRELDAAL